MQSIRILYCSISGNTRNFISKLTIYANNQRQHDATAPTINGIEITDLTPLNDETTPYFVCVPTYLSGGNGIDNGVTELMTNSLGEYITYQNNSTHIKGIIGSGNRNFNEQYVLTARRYATETNSRVIADYELRGTQTDIIRIYDILRTLNK